VAGAAGNPLYIGELVDALARDGWLQVREGAAETAPGTGQFPRSLPGTIVHRLDFLTPAARDVLQVAAVLGPYLRLTELSVILDRPASTLLDVVREAVAGGLLTESGDQLVFRHDLIREALAQIVPPDARSALNLQAGRALAASGAQAERVAYYFIAGDGVDDAVLEWLERAADPLVARAPAVAVDLLGRAVSHTGADDRRAEPLRFQLARALLWAGRPADAERTARAILARGHDSAREGAYRWLLARACFQQGHLRNAEAVAEDALAAGVLSTAEAARFQHFAGQCRFTRGEVDVAAEQAAATRLLDRGDPDSVAYGTYHLGGVRFMQGEIAESLKLVERAAVAFGTQDAQPEWDLAIHLMRAYLLVELDRSAEAEKAFETGLREAERLDSVYLTWYPLGRARLHFVEGRWDDALAEIRAGQETLETLGPVRGLHTGLGLRSHAAIIEIHRRGRAARTTVAREPYVPAGAFFDYLVLWAQALAWEADGHPEMALAALYEFWKHSEGARQQLGLHYLSPDLARLAVAVGEPDKARRVADDLGRLAERQPTPTLQAIHALCHGMATANAGLLLGAADALREAGRPLYHGYARESAAAVLAADGRTAEARVSLAAALELYDGLDAAWDAARAKARLREAGIRSRRTVTGQRARTGWDSLTDTERKVAALVAEGYSNPDIAARMFISRRTVQSHVSSILTKLDCTSRVELAVAAARNTGDPPAGRAGG
jgi:DNA-binding CsgD family transcriptional regulator